MQRLHDAAAALGALANPSLPAAMERSQAIADLDSVLRAAERELFVELMRGPVFRFLQQRGAYIVWAAEVRVTRMLSAGLPAAALGPSPRK
jgi:hypothetical protein